MKDVKVDLGNNEFRITEVQSLMVYQKQANFDKATKEAYEKAISKFGIDDNGHAKNVTNFKRSHSSIVVKFVSYIARGGMGGISHLYRFEAWCELIVEEE